MSEEQCAAVSLVELLRSVPMDAKLSIDTPNALGCMDTHSIPVGRLCHEAADALLWCGGRVDTTSRAIASQPER